MNETTMAIAFLGILIFLFALYQYFTWYAIPQTDESSVLMNMNTQTGHIRGIEREQRVFCPRKAEALLREMVVQLFSRVSLV